LLCCRAATIIEIQRPEIIILIVASYHPACRATQADAMHIQGTPVFLIGPFIKAQELDFAGFRQAVSDARARQSGGSPMKGKP
jgi:hypothetical protein